VQHVAAVVERIRSRESLRESRRQFSTLISNLQGMTYNSPDWTELTFASEGCKELTGYDPDTLDLESAARQAWAGVDTRGLELVVVDEGRLRADEDRFRRLLENCYLNAATHADGATTVRVGLEEGTLFVEDDGPGIPEDDPTGVLEAGYSTAQRSPGLGLSVVTQVADAHDWEVRVTDGDEGARFEVAGVDLPER